MQLIDQYKIGDWPEWADTTIGTGEDVVTTPSLCTLIKQKFTQGEHPKYMLKQLHELKQGQKDMKEYLTEFENLKLLSKISSDHTMEILQTNVQWDMIKQFILLYGPPADYNYLKHNLIELGHADAYLKAICHPTFIPFNCSYVPTPPTPA